MSFTDEDAIAIACPSDEAAFREYLSATASLRELPKAHLHIHINAMQQNCKVKAALESYNSDPTRLPIHREHMVQKAEDLLKVGNGFAGVKLKLQLEAGLLDGDKLRLPSIFWTDDGSLKNTSFDMHALDAVCPWGGATGWNGPDNLWHGMGGFRDYNLVVNDVLSKLGGVNLPDEHSKEYWITASRDAHMEGIRWVEYCHHPGDLTPDVVDDDSGKLTGSFSADAWKKWSDYLVALHADVTAAVPEVGICWSRSFPPHAPNNFSSSEAAAYVKQYATSFASHWEKDPAIQKLVPYFSEVGAANPGANSEVYTILMKAGLSAANIHVGEWSPAPDRACMAEESKARMESALDLGVKRFGHGIFAHTDPDLMVKLRSANVCLEVCPTSNRILDNVPGGLKTHPLRVLYDNGVPCALAADDPAHAGSPCGHGLVREFLVARDFLDFNPSELAQLAKNSFQHSMAPEDVKMQAMKDIDDWLSRQ